MIPRPPVPDWRHHASQAELLFAYRHALSFENALELAGLTEESRTVRRMRGRLLVRRVLGNSDQAPSERHREQGQRTPVGTSRTD